MKKTTRDYGLGRCCNHDLRRWDAYGGGGAGNSEATSKVLKGQARKGENFFQRGRAGK